MDLGFARRNRNHLIAGAIPLDYHRLLARLAAEQAASPTGQAAARASAGQSETLRPFDALVALFDPRPTESVSLRALGGSFHPRTAGADPCGGRQSI